MGTKTSTLLITSSGADVVVTGQSVKITGLPAIRKGQSIDYSLKVAATEVVQVVTVGSTAYTPTASTRYKLLIGDKKVKVSGKTSDLKSFSYTTPAVITDLGATAALQREAIHLALVAQINAFTAGSVVAATLGTGTGFTVTDEAGYYPYNRQGMSNRLGANTVKVVSNDSGTGFSPSNMVLTTPAVYAFGQGQDLLNAAPVYDLVTNNLISGEIEVIKTAAGLLPIAGQKYNLFNISYAQSVADGSTVGEGSNSSRVFNYAIWVDNGTGTSTANSVGYGTFKTALDAVGF